MKAQCREYELEDATAEFNVRGGCVGHASPDGKALALGMALAFGSAALLALVGCESKSAAAPAGPPPPLPVSVLSIQPTNVPLTGEWVGTLDGMVNAQIQPQVSGYLIRQDYKEGLPVEKGQVLFEIDPRPFQALVDQAEGQVAQAKGAVGQAEAQEKLYQINVDRDTPLAAARAIAQSTLDNDTQQREQAKAAIAAAQAQVESAQAQVATAKLNLGFTQVRSLISGVAGQATVQVGNLVSQQSVLTSVSQLNPIKVFFSISDAEYLALTERARAGGSDLLHGAGSVPLTLTLANGQIYPSKGRIAYVDRSLNAQTGAIRIAAVFPNPGNVLRPGQFGRITAETEVRRDVLLVPQSAVSELQGQEQVYTVGPGNKAHVVNVTLGPQFSSHAGSFWVVNGGLSPGSQIITDNLQKLAEGAPVAPHAAPPTPPLVSDTTGQPAGR
jgi:membrane fusion protein (multidrug efflux system)